MIIYVIYKKAPGQFVSAAGAESGESEDKALHYRPLLAFVLECVEQDVPSWLSLHLLEKRFI